MIQLHLICPTPNVKLQIQTMQHASNQILFLAPTTCTASAWLSVLAQQCTTIYTQNVEQNNFRFETTLPVLHAVATIFNLQHNIYPQFCPYIGCGVGGGSARRIECALDYRAPFLPICVCLYTELCENLI